MRNVVTVGDGYSVFAESGIAIVSVKASLHNCGIYNNSSSDVGAVLPPDPARSFLLSFNFICTLAQLDI